MDRAEAKKWFAQMRPRFKDDTEIAEALDLAIEALGDAESATNTDCNDCIWNTCNYNKIDWEVSEDCISRQEAIDAFNEECDRLRERISTRKGLNYHDESERIELFECRLAEAEHWKEKMSNLPPVTPTVSDDCISRDYMLKLQRELHGWMPNDKSQELWQKIKDASSVTPTERTGEWIDRRFAGNTTYMTCSVCGEEAYQFDNFCPNCGADMRGDK